MSLADEVYELEQERDELELEVERLKAELQEKDMIKPKYYTVYNGEAYLESIDEFGNTSWTANKYEALQKSTYEEAQMLARRAGLTVTLKEVA